MDVQQYLHNRPDRGAFTAIARFAPPTPELPHCVSGRRMDVFQCYRALVETHREQAPIQAYAFQLRDAQIATANAGKSGTAVHAGGQSLPMLFPQAEPSERLLPAPDAPRLAGRSAVITEVTAGDNYYHWLLTALPKLLLLMYRHNRLSFDHLIVNDGDSPFVHQTLDFLGVPRDIIISAAQSPVLRLDDAYFAAAYSELIYPHSLIPEMFRAVFPRQLYRASRLFISRRDSRTLSNESEILDILRPLGFQPVILETLTIAEQIRLFAQAESIIGPHGAGMSNLIFSPTRTKVLEIFSPEQVSATYWFLANACGHEYHYMLGQGVDQPIQSKNWRSAERPEITLDPAEFRAALAALQLP